MPREPITVTRGDTWEINRRIMYEYRLYGMDVCLWWPRREKK